MAEAATSAHGLARVNGIELAYQIQGSGKPLVLLHGSFGSAEMFGPLLRPWPAAVRSSGSICSSTAARRRSTDQCGSRPWPTTSQP